MTFTIMTFNGTTETFGETPEIQERLAPTRIAQHGEEQVIPGVKGDSSMKLVPGVEYALVPYRNSRIWIRTSGFTYFSDGTHMRSDRIIYKPYYKDFGGEHQLGDMKAGDTLGEPEIIQDNQRQSFLRQAFGALPDIKRAIREIL